jgi:hypothetical protein
LVISNGNGIDFSATGDATGASSELLDDYEEGTWTPYLASTGTNPTVTYTNQAGYYTKVGRLITLQFYMQAATVSGGSGSMIITGIPYAIGNLSAGYGSTQNEYNDITMPSDANNIFTRTNPNNSYLSFEWMDTRAGVVSALRNAVPIADCGNATRVLGSVTYFTN